MRLWLREERGNSVEAGTPKSSSSRKRLVVLWFVIVMERMQAVKTLAVAARLAMLRCRVPGFGQFPFEAADALFRLGEGAELGVVLAPK